MKNIPWRAFLTISILLIPLTVGGCPWITDTGDTTTVDPKLSAFQSSSDVVDYFRQQATNRTQTRSRGIFGIGLWAAAENEGSLADDSATGAEQTSDGDTNYSTTNLQEAGVDESDLFKSDGTNFYIAKGRSLRIVQAADITDLNQVGQLDLDTAIDDIYLVGSTLIALGTSYTYTPAVPAPGNDVEIAIWPLYSATAFVAVTQIDVSDPQTPVIVGENTLDGSLVSSRLVDGRLILILTVAPDLPDEPSTDDIDAVAFEEIVPKMQCGEEVAEAVVAVEDWYHPANPDGYNTTLVVTLDATDVETVLGSLAVMADAGTIYASTDAVYLTDTTYDYDSELREHTIIHKLAFDADGLPEYVASGQVPGRLLSQFSLGEYEDVLRVATHVSNWNLWNGGAAISVATAGSSDAAVSVDTAQSTSSEAPTGPYNAVYTLEVVGEDLSIIGSVENIAPGEDLYAVRFMGERGFLVTYEIVDPLFTLDLSDPEQPTVVGELEVPGYSDYLHPFGDNFLIGVGRSTLASEWGSITNAIQLSLFDISDLANPTVIDQIEVGGYGSYSDVSYTHKAFTFMPDSGLLAIPAALTGNDYNAAGGWIWSDWTELVICYQVDETGFTERGRLPIMIYEDSGWTAWRRAAFIDDNVYALSPAGVSAAPITDFESYRTFVLTPNAADDPDLPIFLGGSVDDGGEDD